MPQSHSFTQVYSQHTNVLLTDVLVGPAFNPRTSEKPIDAKKYRGIWDTGATGSVITKKIVNECGLRPIGMKRVVTAGGTIDTSEYLVAIGLPNGVGIPMIRVTEAKDLGGGTDLLVGMDIIAAGDFAITNLGGKTVFSFRTPSLETIDFVKQANAQAPKVGRNSPCPCGSGKKYKKCHALKL